MTAPLPLPELSVVTPRAEPVRAPHESQILYGTTALLMFCVLAFGGREARSFFIFQAASVLLLLVWMAIQLRMAQVTVTWNRAFAPMIAFGALLCLQLLPGRSAYWHATYSQSLRFVAYGVICFLLVQTLKRNRQIRFIGYALTIFGTSVGVLAVIQNLSSPNKLYWLLTPRAGGWIYGPYVNHNHYAGLMEMLLPVPLVFAFSRFAHQREKWLAASAAAFMAATIFLSGSRGGMIAFAVEMATFVYFVFREREKRSAGVLLSAFLVFCIAVIAWTGGREVKARIATLHTENHSDLSSDVRLQIDRDVLTMWRTRPLFGWGQGTFVEVYPRFRSFYTDSLVNAAHNDFLQLLMETGIAGFAIMIWFLVSTLRPAFRKSQKWQSNLNGAVSVTAILGITGILVHSLVDFNMQIPANAAIFYSLCTIAAMEARFTSHRRSRRKAETDLPVELPVEPSESVNA